MSIINVEKFSSVCMLCNSSVCSAIASVWVNLHKVWAKKINWKHCDIFLCFLGNSFITSNRCISIILFRDLINEFNSLFLFSNFKKLSVYVVVGGMNGSVVYELERPENAGLKKSVKACSVSLFSLTPSSPLRLLLE